MSDPNFKCPKCGCTDELSVTVELERLLLQNENGVQTTSLQHADEEWDSDSLMRCHHCGHAAKVWLFDLALLEQRRGNG